MALAARVCLPFVHTTPDVMDCLIAKMSVP